MFQLQGFSCFINNFSLFWLHSFPVLLTFFPCLLYRVFPVLLKTQIYKDFPVLITTFLCFNYRVFPGLKTPFPFFVTLFPCLVNIFSLFNLQGFPCFNKNSDLQGFPCIGYNFFIVQLQGFPWFNDTIFLFWLHYCPALLTCFPCLIYRVFHDLVNFYVVVFQRAGKSLL